MFKSLGLFKVTRGIITVMPNGDKLTCENPDGGWTLYFGIIDDPYDGWIEYKIC